MFRIPVLVPTVLCAAHVPDGEAAAPAASEMRTSIPPQSLSTALQTWARESGIQVMYATRLAKGRQSRGAPAGIPADEALKRILAGTGLSYRVLSERAVSVFAVKEAVGSDSPADQMRMAMETEQRGGKERQAADGESAAQVVVKGERDRTAPFSTANLDLTRTEDDALPFTVFTARDIELSGASSLQDFLRERLPQNFSPTILEERGGTGLSALNGEVDMRGWGAAETVILLNGRRMPAQYQQTSSDTANAMPYLQGIPLGSIARIEILPSAGSAIYGVGSTGGVINFITREDYRGGQLTMNYETPSDTHAPRRGMDLSYGMPLRWGLGLRVGASYNESHPMYMEDRSAVSIERWRRLALERAPALLVNPLSGNPFQTSSLVFGATPNIRAATTNGDLFDTMTGIQNFTSVPAGATGGSTLSVYQPGAYNLGMAEGSAGLGLYGRKSSLGSDSSNSTLNVGLDRDFGPKWRWSLDLRHSRNETEGRNGGALQFENANPNSFNPVVPAATPSNPFSQPVWIALVDPYLARRELANRYVNTNWDLSSVLRGQIGEWRGFIDVSYSHNDNDSYLNNFHEPSGGWTAAFLSGRYDPFVDPRARPPGAAGFYEDYIAERFSYFSATRNYSSTIKASGPLLNLPAGTLQLTAGLDASRSDRYHSEYLGLFVDGMSGVPRIPVGSTSSVSKAPDASANRRFRFGSYAAYSEVVAPLLSPAQAVPLVQRLELSASGRFNRMVRDGFRSQSVRDLQNGVPPVPVTYENDSHLSMFGLRYEMFEGVLFRASRSLGFKPPSLAQVAPSLTPPGPITRNQTDPVRQEALDPNFVTMVTGGNPDLRPETTRSTNVGLIFTPPWIGGLRVSVDYLESVRDDAIFTLSIADVFNLESELPQLVLRDSPDGHPSGVGRVLQVDLRQFNLRQISSRSMDFSVEQRLENVGGGRLVFTAAATRNLSFKVQTTNTGAAVEQLRNTSSVLSRQIEWNGNAQVRWEGPRWSVGWNARYYDYLLARTTDYVLQGGDRAPWKVNHDVNVSYTQPDSGAGRGHSWLWSGVSLTFGVKNLFDRKPRFWARYTDSGVAPYDSVMGRSVWMQMRKSFQ